MHHFRTTAAALACSAVLGSVPVTAASDATAPEKRQRVRRRRLQGTLLDPRTTDLSETAAAFLYMKVTEQEAATAEISFDYREDFAVYVHDFAEDYLPAMAVEVGVFDGDFAEMNRDWYRGEYFMVDPVLRPLMQTRLDDWGSRAHFLEKKSKAAASMFEDESLDWVYIDARHTYKNVKEDMKVWWPKLKSGGLFSGYDYCVTQKEREQYPDVPWCGVYGDDDKDMSIQGKAINMRLGMEKVSMLKVAMAVQEFAAEHGLKVKNTLEGREGPEDDEPSFLNPSWYIFKP